MLIWEQHLFKTFQKCTGNNVILLLYALFFFKKPFKIRLRKKTCTQIATGLTEANKSHYGVSLELGVNKFPPTTILSARKSGSCWAIVLVVRRAAPQNNPAAYRSERCLWHRPHALFFYSMAVIVNIFCSCTCRSNIGALKLIWSFWCPLFESDGFLQGCLSIRMFASCCGWYLGPRFYFLLSIIFLHVIARLMAKNCVTNNIANYYLSH